MSKSRTIVVCLSWIVFMALGCQLVPGLAGPQPAPAAGAATLDASNIQSIASTEAALERQAAPTRSAPEAVIQDEIGIEYVYTDGLVTALYHMYGGLLDHFVDITLTNYGSAAVTLLVQTEVESYTQRASDTITLAAGDSLEIHQNPRLMPEALDRLNSERPGNFHIRVVQLVNGQERLLLEETREILLYSRRDFVWIDGFEWWEEYELWAAWVTPNDPSVEALLRAAADYTGSGDMWSGYGGHLNDDNGGVWERLEAIWNAEAEVYHLTYVSTMTAFGPNTVQRMRLPAEVLDQASGNCVELATLFNSAVEAIRLESAIVRIPGHAYVAVRMDDVNADYYFIETTLIGSASFADAVEVGAEEWFDAQPHFDAQEQGYAWVTITHMREKGILPIPWR